MKRRFLTLLVVTFCLWGCSPSGPEEGNVEKGKTGDEAAGGAEKAGPGKVETPAKTPAEKGSATEPQPAGGMDPLIPWRKMGDPVAAAGSVELPSGLQYAVLKKGSGESPPLGATVKVHFTAWLRSGDRLARKCLDSRDDGVPQEFLLAQESPLAGPEFSLDQSKRPVIPGWVEALRTMKKGERRWLIVPSALAYGDRGFDRMTVPPRADLVFDLELVDFSKP
jgi:hypothetical protein